MPRQRLPHEASREEISSSTFTHKLNLPTIYSCLDIFPDLPGLKFNRCFFTFAVFLIKL